FIVVPVSSCRVVARLSSSRWICAGSNERSLGLGCCGCTAATLGSGGLGGGFLVSSFFWSSAIGSSLAGSGFFSCGFGSSLGLASATGFGGSGFFSTGFSTGFGGGSGVELVLISSFFSVTLPTASSSGL